MMDEENAIVQPVAEQPAEAEQREQCEQREQRKKKLIRKPKEKADKSDCGCGERFAKIERCLRFCLKTLYDIAGEQANRSYSGSHWLAVTRHGIQLMEKDMGFGDGPKTDKPA